MDTIGTAHESIRLIPTIAEQEGCLQRDVSQVEIRYIFTCVFSTQFTSSKILYSYISNLY